MIVADDVKGKKKNEVSDAELEIARLILEFALELLAEEKLEVKEEAA